MDYGDKRESDAFSISSNDASPRHQVMAAITVAWKRFQKTLPCRLAILEQASAALEEGTLGDELRQQAQAEAHKIAGTAGVFGVPQGSQLARNIELMLQSTAVLDQTPASHFSELVRTLRAELEQPLQ